MMDLLVKWSLIFSQNKYKMGLTQEEFVIWLINKVPVKSYTPRNSPTVKKAIEDKLDKLKKEDLLSLQLVHTQHLLYV